MQKSEQSSDAPVLPRKPGSFRGDFFVALLATLLYWAAFPPLRLSVLIWGVPVAWTVLIRRTDAGPCISSWNTGRYLKIYAAGVFFWLISFGWMGMATLPLKVGWIIFSISLGLFWCFFVGLCRTAVHRMQVPVIFAAPIIWCGLEWFRKNWLLGGFSFASLEHTQYENLAVIQIADLFGEYGVGMLIVFAGTCIGRTLPIPTRPLPSRSAVARIVDSRAFAVVACAVTFALVVLYGHERLASTGHAREDAIASPRAKIALLQASTGATIDQTRETRTASYRECRKLTRQAALEVDLVVWPECACPLRLYHFEPDFVPDNWLNEPEDAVKAFLQETLQKNHAPIIALADAVQVPLLLGVRTSVYERGAGFSALRNSAVLVDPLKGVGPRYDKCNLIPFAEVSDYPMVVPADFKPLFSFTPGAAIPVFPIRAHRVATTQQSLAHSPENSSARLWATVNICYDSSFPHFVRRQVNASTERGTEPDVVINISDVAFCRFSAQIDMLLATQVFRAIENRKPYLCATAGGYSAWIDSTGRIVKKGEKGAATYVVAEVYRESTMSLYRHWGDWLPICCMCFNALVALSWGYRKLSFSLRSAGPTDSN